MLCLDRTLRMGQKEYEQARERCLVEKDKWPLKFQPTSELYTHLHSEKCASACQKYNRSTIHFI